MASAARTGRFTRRLFLGLAIGLTAGSSSAQDAGFAVRIVSRERLLRENASALRLQQAETDLTARLQALVDATKDQLAKEEGELTQLRSELPASEFEARVVDFDQRVRLARQVAQERAQRLQRVFQEARARTVAHLPDVLERLRVESGADLILNRESVLAAGGGVDLTDRAIELFNEIVPVENLPEMDVSVPLIPPADGQ